MRVTEVVLQAFLLAGVAVSDPLLRGSPPGTREGEVPIEEQNETLGAIPTENPQGEVAEQIGEMHVETLMAGWGWHTWTIVAGSSESGWAWNVRRVKFLTASGEELSPTTPGCHGVESGHAETPGYGLENAFVDGGSIWGGRKDPASGTFYLGVACSGNRQVTAVKLEQYLPSDGTKHYVEYVSIYRDTHSLKDHVWAIPLGWMNTIWHAPRGVYRPEQTCGGNAEGAACTFPFTYQGISYDECSMVNHYKLWCSVDAEYKGRWGNCEC